MSLGEHAGLSHLCLSPAPGPAPRPPEPLPLPAWGKCA